MREAFQRERSCQEKEQKPMTRAEILNTPAGKEMDALIAEKVMGWKKLSGKVNILVRQSIDLIMLNDGAQELVPRYSTDISAAWEVIQHFLGTGRKRPKIDRVSEGEWRVQIDDWEPDAVAYSSSAPLAICRAAMLAVIEMKQETS